MRKSAVKFLVEVGAMNKGELTRRRIVALAAPVFNRKGLAGTSVTDLMEATGLEKGGIYRHFESKQALAEDAFDYAWKIAVETRLEGTAAIANTVDRLKQIVMNFSERREGLVPGGCPLMNTAIETDDGEPRMRAKASRALNGWLRRMRSVIEEGQRRGEIRVDVDAAELATLIVSTLEGGLMLSRLKKSRTPMTLTCRHLAQHIESLRVI